MFPRQSPASLVFMPSYGGGGNRTRARFPRHASPALFTRHRGLAPWLDDGDVRLYHGDCLDVLRGLPDGCVHMCATSPPFYGLRDYGVDEQIGLEETPDQWVARLVEVFREVRRVLRDDGTLWVEIGSSYVSSDLSRQRAHALAYGTDGTEPEDSSDPDSSCSDRDDGRSDGTRSRRRRSGRNDQPPALDGQPDEPTGRDSELGDSAQASADAAPPDARESTTRASSRRSRSPQPTEHLDPLAQHSSPVDVPLSEDTEACISDNDSLSSESRNQGTGASGTAWIEYTRSLKPKDMLPQPWLLGMALQMDGWYLRADIQWSRPNPMPESVTDRPTKAHSTILLLSKSARYFYDADAIREAPVEAAVKGVSARPGRFVPEQTRHGVGNQGMGSSTFGHYSASGANARSVWTIPTEPTPFAHFATWPQKLVSRMIQAGTSERGCCPQCGAPWKRETARTETSRVGGNNVKGADRHANRFSERTTTITTTTGWSASCDHGWDDHEPVPCTVLDPFAGSGTTLKVARDHARHAIGIELNEDYCRIAAGRLAQQSLLTGDAA